MRCANDAAGLFASVTYSFHRGNTCAAGGAPLPLHCQACCSPAPPPPPLVALPLRAALLRDTPRTDRRLSRSRQTGSAPVSDYQFWHSYLPSPQNRRTARTQVTGFCAAATCRQAPLREQPHKGRGCLEGGQPSWARSLWTVPRGSGVAPPVVRRQHGRGVPGSMRARSELSQRAAAAAAHADRGCNYEITVGAPLYSALLSEGDTDFGAIFSCSSTLSETTGFKMICRDGARRPAHFFRS